MVTSILSLVTITISVTAGLQYIWWHPPCKDTRGDHFRDTI